MIEFLDLPAVLVMTFNAIAAAELGTEIRFVDVLVAGLAFRGFQSVPMIFDGLGWRVDGMALRTFEIFMRAFERIMRISGVIEFDIVLPGAHAVAHVAILLGELAAESMRIRFPVTRNTRRRFSEIKNVGLADGALGPLLNVTLGALDIRVFAFEGESGFLMVERLLVDVNGVVIASLMVVMTMDAGIDHQTVIAAFLVDLNTDFFVTVQALRVRNAFAGLVAFQTLAALEILVSFDQRTWREKLVQQAFALTEGGRRDKQQGE